MKKTVIGLVLAVIFLVACSKNQTIILCHQEIRQLPANGM